MNTIMLIKKNKTNQYSSFGTLAIFELNEVPV